MALAFTSRVDHIINGKRVVEAVATFDNNYPTGGEAFTAASLGLHVVDAIALPSHKVQGRGAVSDAQAQVGCSLQLDLTDPTTPKLKIYTSAATEAGSTSDQSAVAVVVWFFGS